MPLLPLKIKKFKSESKYRHHRVRSQVQDYSNDIQIEKVSRNFLKQNIDDLISTSTYMLRPDNLKQIKDEFEIPKRLMKPKLVKQSLNSTFYLPLSTLSTNIPTQNAHVIPKGRDTSLGNATNEINRRWNRYKKMQSDLLHLKASQCDLLKKQILLRQIKQNLPHVKLSEYGILVMSSYDLESFYYTELNKIKQAQAAIKIQSLYRMNRDRKRVKHIQMLRLDATIKIQNMWKKCRWHRLVKQMVVQKQNYAATTVRKYVVGYIVTKKVQEDLQIKRLEDSQKYFERKRLEILTNAQIKISYHWRRYKKIQLKKLQNKKKQGPKKIVDQRKNSNYFQKPGPSWGYSKFSKNKTMKMI